MSMKSTESRVMKISSAIEGHYPPDEIKVLKQIACRIGGKGQNLEKRYG